MNLKKIFAGDNYTSPSATPSVLARMLPSVAFYPAMLHQVWCSAQAAKKPSYDGAMWAIDSFNIMQIFERVGTRVEIEGLNHYKQLDTPCIFIANHMSTLETFVLPSFIQPFKDVTFVVKKSLTEYPLFKHIVGARNPIAVSRTNPREDLSAVLNGGVERLSQGQSIIIFPQSTRTKQFDAQQFNSIGIKLARKAGVPVVPVALKTDAWDCGSLVKDFGAIHPERTIRFRFSSPLTIRGNGKEEHARICDFIASTLAEWN